MDRNLGALDDRYHAAADIKAKYYQFGRKDPFNSDIYCWTYDSETFAPTKTPTASGYRENKSKSDIDSSNPGGYNTEGHNVPFSVMHPNVFITSTTGVWSSTTDLFGGTKLEDNKTTKYWNDPRPAIRTENEEITLVNENKSIFDPCPPGWRLSVMGCIDFFVGDINGSATGNPKNNFQWGVDSEFKNRGRGRTYIPLGYISQKGNKNAQTAFFPASGFLNSSASINLVGIRGYYLYNSPGTTTDGHLLYLDESSIYTQTYLSRAYGFSVRCVKEQ